MVGEGKNGLLLLFFGIVRSGIEAVRLSVGCQVVIVVAATRSSIDFKCSETDLRSLVRLLVITVQ